MVVNDARILSGKDAAAVWRAEVAGRVGSLAADGLRPGIATLLIGDDPASEVYVRMKLKAAEATGLQAFGIRLEASASQAEVEEAVGRLNDDPRVHGFLVQLPLPAHLDPAPILQRIDPAKDADGLHATNLGRLVLGLPGPGPATPTGILRLLDHFGVGLVGSRVTVVGRSQLVGRPLSIMMSAPGRDATVTVVHSKTADLAEATRSADILVVAMGRPGFIGAEHVADGAAVIDVGTTRVDDRLVGDVRFEEVAAIAGAITPVPGGVGPMTIAALLANTVMLAESNRSR
jgi:methylenetetrahydrofolate dehydrogenase (NADP+) / methenyltetrahydrofolate cyclohydrolase